MKKQEDYKQTLSQLASDKLVYLDEVGIKQTLAREYGWAMVGKKVFGKTCGKRAKKMNGIAAYSQGQLIAPLLYNNSMNTDFFNFYLKNCLLPAIEPGSDYGQC